MKLTDLLPPRHILVPLASDTLPDALSEMLRHLDDAGVIRDRDALERSMRDRRSRDLVLIGTGVALPHYRTRAVDRLVVALGIARQPLRGGDLRPETAPRIVAVILAPPEQATLYLQTVSALARLLRRNGVVERLLEARSADDVLAMPELRDARVSQRLTVRDLMTHIDSVAPDMPVSDAVDLMIRKRLRAVPVLNEKREVLGILSEWDVMRGLLPQIPRGGARDDGGAAQQLKVRDVMTRSVLCVSEDLAVEEAANMMINKDVEQFPVVSEGKLTGFLSRSDIIRKLFGP